MFRWFENLVNPFPNPLFSTPPKSFWAFVWSCTEGMRPFIVAMTLLTACIGAFEALLFAMMGKVVDRLGDIPRQVLWDYHLRELKMCIRDRHNANGCIGDPNGTFCNWSQIGLSFSGIAKSINFTNALNTAAFDNITLGANLAAVPVPEPETYAMMLAGLGLMGFVVRRRKENQV